MRGRAIRQGLVAAMVALGAAGPALAQSPSTATEARRDAGRRLALLVGVSDYPAPDQRLEGPANDVPLLHRALLRRGFGAGDIRVLADRVADPALRPDGLPTRAAILAEFARLVEAARAGDQVVVLLSGHGSRQPVTPETAAGEADGMDEVFLPLDVEPTWRDGPRSIRNGLLDDEIGAFVRALRARGAHVFLVVDSCHSGTMTRAAAVRSGAPRPRGVDPARFGLPSSVPPAASAPDAIDVAPGDAGLVAFYAAQADEVALELPLPARRGAGAPAARYHGLLTFNLVRALEGGAEMTYRALAQQVLSGYDATRGLAATWPTPLFEGDLDQPALGAAAELPRGRTVARLPNGRWRLDAGRLHGIEPGDSVAIHLPDSPDGPPVVTATVEAADFAESRLAVAWPAGTPVPRHALGVVASGPRPGAPLRIARPPRATGAEALLAALSERLAGSSLAELVAPEAEAELRLVVDAGGLWLVPNGGTPAAAAASGDRPVQLPEPGREAATAARLARRVEAVVRGQHLLRAAERFAQQGPTGLEATLRVLRRNAAPTATGEAPRCEDGPDQPPPEAVRIQAEAVPALAHCDVLYVTLRNGGRQPIDAGICYIGPTGELAPAPGGAAQRLAPRSEVTLRLPPIFAWSPSRRTALPTGAERLVVLGVRREADRAAVAFTMDLAREACGPAELATRSAAQPDDATQALLAAVRPDVRQTRSAGAGSAFTAAGALVLRWTTLAWR